MNSTGAVRYWLVLLLILIPAGVAAAEPTDIVPLEEIIEKTALRYQSVNDYTGILHRREFVGGKVREESDIIFKFMKPEHYYLKWTGKKYHGTEVIFVRGKYDDKMVVHLGGILGFFNLSLNPEGRLARRNNRHSITEAGIGTIIQRANEYYLVSRERKDGAITYEGEKEINGKALMLFKSVFPEGKGYYGHIILLYFDKELSLPVKITVYGWEDEFLEDYHYENIELNTGLTEKDFDTKNPEYNFR